MNMKRLLVLLLSFWLAACGAEQGREPDWFQFQYENGSPIDALTECGPTVASNALCWQTGQCNGREYARSTRLSPSWWYMAHISYFINNGGGVAEPKNFSKQAVSSDIYSGALVVIHINQTHFVTVQVVSNEVVVHDTNYGSYSVGDLDAIPSKISFGKYIKVPKL